MRMVTGRYPKRLRLMKRASISHLEFSYGARTAIIGVVSWTRREALRFRVFGFLQCRHVLSSSEIHALSAAFDLAMERAARHRPTPSGERQQVVPFFDYDSDAFYPLLDDERLVEVFEDAPG